MSDPPRTSADPFVGLRVIVTGGTSGIGLACVNLLNLRRSRVQAIGKPSATCSSSDIPDHRSDISASPILADLTDFEQSVQACEAAFDRLGGLDAVIHTVGSSSRAAGDGPLTQCTVPGWQASLRSNLDSAFFVMRWSIAKMTNNTRDRFGQRGSIAVVSSVLSDNPSPLHFGTIGYAVAKSGLESLARHSAATYANDGIRVNVLKPGLVDTPMAARAIGDPVIGEFIRSKQPLTSGPLSAEACANALLALIDPRNAGLTGAVLTIDGGWSLTQSIRDSQPPLD